MTEDNLLDRQASGTALATAFMRALAACDPREEIRGSDTLAQIFLTDEQRKPLSDLAARAWVMQNRLTPGAVVLFSQRHGEGINCNAALAAVICPGPKITGKRMRVR